MHNLLEKLKYIIYKYIMFRSFDINDYEYCEKMKEYPKNGKYTISGHHALFDEFLHSKFGNNPIKTLEFFINYLSQLTNDQSIQYIEKYQELLDFLQLAYKQNNELKIPFIKANYLVMNSINEPISFNWNELLADFPILNKKTGQQKD